jgi:transposase InsO family protein
VTTGTHFALIQDWQKMQKYPVARICSVLSVSETGYYKWKRTRNKPKAWQLLLVKIYKILDEHPDNKNYGIDRIQIALKQRGDEYSRSTVIRAMKKGNLLHKSRRSSNGLTKADKKAQKPDNLLCQDFTARKPNEKWLTDITEIQCADGKLYIAPVFDCFGGEIISLAMDTNMKKELCIKALNDAYRIRRPGYGVIMHSDAGSQYTSLEYKKLLANLRIIPSMGNVGKCYDNARMESFFATLKKEKVYQLKTKSMTVEEVKLEVWRYIMIYYNRQRISTVNKGGLPPTKFRESEAKLSELASA